jgi:uncharacterized membrane protein YeaQ/YmgE (transglycosylase-associated protein family)
VYLGTVLAHPTIRAGSAGLKGDVMHILWSLIVGLVVGAIAKLIMPGKDPGGLVVTSLLGVVGAVIAGFAGRALGWYTAPNSTPGIIASVIGAVIVLAVYRGVVGMRHRHLHSH